MPTSLLITYEICSQHRHVYYNNYSFVKETQEDFLLKLDCFKQSKKIEKHQSAQPVFNFVSIKILLVQIHLASGQKLSDQGITFILGFITLHVVLAKFYPCFCVALDSLASALKIYLNNFT